MPPKPPMHWYRIWAKSNCPSGLGKEEYTYEFYNDVPSDDSLKEMAMEHGESIGLGGTERGFKYGYEYLGPTADLDPEVRKKLIRKYERHREAGQRQIDQADEILNRLLEKPVTTTTRFKRKEPV